jgi:hypothetical protein
MNEKENKFILMKPNLSMKNSNQIASSDIIINNSEAQNENIQSKFLQIHNSLMSVFETTNQ